ncbi:MULTISPECIES: YycH family regulatory protein [Heyndrickxia]|uniref:YycH family regulatory protein n=1 Tax=Heyndrickxia TaxID=2837504 RepID=UPI001B1CA511|nr:two-component system activity regulator YycH [Heyndrickxia oleronia]GIN40060.1 hypothetical protein J19TS1_30090 [Heyndrickxia oleronia]
MKYETMKTVILVFLVGVSIYLTWTLWTFQVNYEEINNSEPVKEVVEPKEVKEIVQPNKLVFHENDHYVGTTNETEINRVMDEIAAWKFYDIGEAKAYRSNDINKVLNGPNKLIIEFPDLVPFELYKGVLRVSDREIPNEEFDILVIDLSNPSQKVATAYFINTKGNANKVFSGSASYSSLQAFVNKIKNKNESYVPYDSYKVTNGRFLLLPKDSVKLNRNRYYWDKLDGDIIERYKNALFPDPKVVEKSLDGNNVGYNDGTSFLNAKTDLGTISFINPGEITGNYHNGKDLIKRSIDFVNQNGGWNDDFRYFSKNQEKNQVIFRLFMNGIPVFNNNHLAEIVQSWGESQIYEYERPYIDEMGSLLMTDYQEVQLPSASSVLESLLKDDKIDHKKIENILVGYQLDYDSVNKILLFEPTWYYQYDGKWQPWDIKGEKYGLE